MAAAMELSVSMIAVNCSGVPGAPGANDALSRRFPSPVINEAFARLRDLGFVLHASNPRYKTFQLSISFYRHTEVMSALRQGTRLRIADAYEMQHTEKASLQTWRSSALLYEQINAF